MYLLQNVADYIRTGKAISALKSLLTRKTKIISFTDEKENRPPRFVAVIEAYKSGMPIKEIADKFGCSLGTVHRYARMAGLFRPNESSVKDGILAMYQQNKPIAEIAAFFGVSQALVSKYASEAGINRNKHKKK